MEDDKGGEERGKRTDFSFVPSALASAISLPCGPFTCMTAHLSSNTHRGPLLGSSDMSIIISYSNRCRLFSQYGLLVYLVSFSVVHLLYWGDCESLEFWPRLISRNNHYLAKNNWLLGGCVTILLKQSSTNPASTRFTQGAL